jgi:hypothetical protein
MTGGSDVWLSTRAALRVWLVWAMGLFVVAFAGALALRAFGLIPALGRATSIRLWKVKGVSATGKTYLPGALAGQAPASGVSRH